jgi:RNA polymerase sigma factor for flagellar operon FliA
MHRTQQSPASGDPGGAASTVDRLVREHLPLVQYIVSDFVRKLPRSIERDDLIAAGMLGLAQAAASYDDARSVSFPRYARIRINGAILDDLRSRDFATRSVRSMGRVLDTESQQLTSDLGRAPTPAELAHRLGVGTTEIARIRAELDRAVIDNLDPWNDETSAPSSPDPEPLAVLISREDRSYVRDAIAQLPERLRRVVVGYFIDDRPMQELADELGVTESRISQMRKEALTLMAEALRSAGVSIGATAAARDGDDDDDPPGGRRATDRAKPDGVAARRRATYVSSVMSASDFRSRISPSAHVVATEAV